MNAERVRKILLGLPHVVETEQWGGLVFWVGDRDLGGKMVVMLPLDGHGPLISYPTGVERFAELVEQDGIIPAPYLARIFWVSAERWDVFRASEWEQELRAAHSITYDKLPPRVKKTLALPREEFKSALEAGRLRRAAREATERIRRAGKKARGQSPMNLN